MQFKKESQFRLPTESGKRMQKIRDNKNEIENILTLEARLRLQQSRDEHNQRNKVQFINQ